MTALALAIGIVGCLAVIAAWHVALRRMHAIAESALLAGVRQQVEALRGDHEALSMRLTRESELRSGMLTQLEEVASMARKSHNVLTAQRGRA